MNRQMKRMQEKAERQQKSAGVDRPSRPGRDHASRPDAGEAQAHRHPSVPEEVRQELQKVDWPNRRELISYTVVVLVTIVVMTAFVFRLDYVFLKSVVKLFG